MTKKYSFLFNFCLFFSNRTGTYGLSTSDPTIATNWITKDVCADNLNRPIQFDPFYACPSGSTRRKILPTDPLPYSNIDQKGIQQSDSVPVYDINRNPLYLSTFDYFPFNVFNLNSGSDGYDAYNINPSSTYVGVASTRDGGGYGQQLLGANCGYGTGWIFFPFTNFLAGGSTTSKISINYWEQSAQSYFGPCPSSYGTTTTSWAYKSSYTFGGLNGNPQKVMSTMISYHGFCASGCNMEVFWFTREYGKTMWQSWVPSSSASTTSPIQGACLDSGTVSYNGQTFIIADCHDWSSVVIASIPQQVVWPFPGANLLQHGHFDPSAPYLTGCGDRNYFAWCRTPSSSTAQPTYINWSVLTSSAFSTTSFGSHQVSYLATNCGGVCNPVNKFIYQDVAIASFVNGGGYLYGMNCRCEGKGCSGSIQIALQVIDATDSVVFQDTAVFQGVMNENGDGRNSEANSVYLSSVFLHKVVTLTWPVTSSAYKVRFSIAPLSSDTFDILDAYLNPFPIMNSKGFGVRPSVSAPSAYPVTAVPTSRLPTAPNLIHKPVPHQNSRI